MLDVTALLHAATAGAIGLSAWKIMRSIAQRVCGQIITPLQACRLHKVHLLPLHNQEGVVQLRQGSHHPCSSSEVPEAPRLEVAGHNAEQLALTVVAAQGIAFHRPQKAGHEVKTGMAAVKDGVPVPWVEEPIRMMVRRHGMDAGRCNAIPAAKHEYPLDLPLLSVASSSPGEVRLLL